MTKFIIFSIYTAVFIILTLITYFKVKNTLYVLKNMTTPVEKIESLITKHSIFIILFFDENTCKRTIKNMKKINTLMKKSNIPYACVNVLENFDEKSGVAPAFEYLDKYQVSNVPSILRFENHQLKACLSKGPDTLPLGEIKNFLGSSDSSKSKINAFL